MGSIRVAAAVDRLRLSAPSLRPSAKRPSHVVIHGELVGMGAKAQGIVFFLFHVDPVRDEVGVEDVAEEHGGKCEIRIRRCVGSPELNSLRFGTGRVSRDANGGGTITR